MIALPYHITGNDLILMKWTKKLSFTPDFSISLAVQHCYLTCLSELACSISVDKINVNYKILVVFIWKYKQVFDDNTLYSIA